MTITEQVKIRNNKNRANKAQYDLDRQNAKISALSSGELVKYEYLVVENLGCKPDVVQKEKLKYSTLDQLFNKGLDTTHKKERLFQLLFTFAFNILCIEGKNEQQLQLIRNQGEKRLNLINKSNLEKDSKQLEIQSYLNPEAKRLMDEIDKEIKDNEDKKFFLYTFKREII